MLIFKEKQAFFTAKRPWF